MIFLHTFGTASIIPSRWYSSRSSFLEVSAIVLLAYGLFVVCSVFTGSLPVVDINSGGIRLADEDEGNNCCCCGGGGGDGEDDGMEFDIGVCTVFEETEVRTGAGMVGVGEIEEEEEDITLGKVVVPIGPFTDPLFNTPGVAIPNGCSAVFPTRIPTPGGTPRPRLIGKEGWPTRR